MTSAHAVLEELLAETRASRVTLRRDVAGAFPVVEEALAAGVASLRDEQSVHLPSQPVVLEIQRGVQVVQNDCATAYEDEAFQRMLAVYGGLAAQIVTPIVVQGRLEAILSVHQLGAPREWTAEEVDAATTTARRLQDLL